MVFVRLRAGLFQKVSCLLLIFPLLSPACSPFHPRGPGAAIYPPIEKPLGGFPVEGIALAIEARDTVEQNLDTFDGDLLRAGVHPIWIQIQNRGNSTLNLAKAKFKLENAGEGKVKVLHVAQVVERLYKGYSIRFYSRLSRKRVEEDFKRLSLHLDSLPPGGETAGYLFVYLSGKQPRSLTGMTLKWGNLSEEGKSKRHVFRFTFPPTGGNQ